MPEYVSAWLRASVVPAMTTGKPEGGKVIICPAMVAKGALLRGIVLVPITRHELWGSKEIWVPPIVIA